MRYGYYLTTASKYFINAFVKSFLYIFTQPDYILSDRHRLSVIQSNLIRSNSIAISDFGTTDPYLELLQFQAHNFNVIVDGLDLSKPTIVFKGKHWYNRAGANLMYKFDSKSSSLKNRSRSKSHSDSIVF